MEKKINVLSIDGGGTRGLMPSTILHCLENETGRSVTDVFDVIVGSATGGIIAASLAAGMRTNEIMEIYQNQASYILPSGFFRRVWNPLNLFAPRYPNKNLKKLLREKFGPGTMMADVYNNFGSGTIFLLASLDLSPELSAGEPLAFKIIIYNSAMAGHQSENLVDLALRTSAAAINLPIYQRYTEGGNYANDPALAGFSFCINKKQGISGESLLAGNKLGLGASVEDVRVLSLGCGSDGGSYFSSDEIGKGNWGLIKWMSRLVNLVIDTNMVYTQYLMNEMSETGNYLRINPYYKSKEAPAVLRNEKLRIDVTKKEHLDAIRSFAEQTFDKEKSRIKAFLEL
ncbi:MAG: patatin-like phospholipase family protein [Cytophagales bacterium]|nr:patatin-like phospholipase family protein [Cytophagales bacterium]